MHEQVNGITMKIPADMKVVRYVADCIDYKGYVIVPTEDATSFEVSPDFGATIYTVSSLDEAREKIERFILQAQF